MASKTAAGQGVAGAPSLSPATAESTGSCRSRGHGQGTSDGSVAIVNDWMCIDT